MNISELSRLAGISPSGVRWYESLGLLPAPARRENGYRSYGPDDLRRLRLLLTMRRLGLSPQDAARVVHWCFDGEPAEDDVAAILAAQRTAIADQREALSRLESELSDLERTIAAIRSDEHGRTSDRREPAGPIAVLFLCNSNSGRSQMGEALLSRLGGERFVSASAGLEPKPVSPLALRVLDELGIDWSAARSKAVDEIRSRRFDYVITLSDLVRERCPDLPGPHNALHWGLDDPAQVTGPESLRLEAYRRTRVALGVRLEPFIEMALRSVAPDASRATLVGRS